MYFSHVSIPNNPQSPNNDVNDGPLNSSCNHKWTLEQRITVCLLKNWYSNSWQDCMIVFNAYFQGVQSCSTPERILTKHTLHSMWYSLEALRSENGILWPAYHETEFSNTSGAWAATRAGLEETAHELGIRLVPRSASVLDPLKTPTSNIVPRRKRHINPFDEGISESEEEPCVRSTTRHCNTQIFQTPSKTANQRQQVQLLTPPSSRHKSSRPTHYYIPRKAPELAYRTFSKESQGLNSDSEFRAGLFLSNSEVSRPLNRNSEAYLHEATRHIDPVASGLTPFVSVTKSLLRALHCSKLSATSSIAVIALEKVGDIHRHEHEGPTALVQSVESLGLKTPGSRNQYMGKGEWLVWGCIRHEAIISVQTIDQFLHAIPILSGNESPFFFDTIRSARCTWIARKYIAKNKTPFTQQNGQAVGALLRVLRIPAEYLEAGINSIVQDWKFCGYNNETGQQNKDFKKGVCQGFQRLEAGPVDLHNPANRDVNGSDSISTHTCDQEGLSDNGREEGAESGELELGDDAATEEEAYDLEYTLSNNLRHFSAAEGETSSTEFELVSEGSKSELVRGTLSKQLQVNENMDQEVHSQGQGQPDSDIIQHRMYEGERVPHPQAPDAGDDRFLNDLERMLDVDDDEQDLVFFNDLEIVLHVENDTQDLASLIEWYDPTSRRWLPC